MSFPLIPHYLHQCLFSADVPRPCACLMSFAVTNSFCLVCSVHEHKLTLSTADDLCSNHSSHDQYTDGAPVRLEELP